MTQRGKTRRFLFGLPPLLALLVLTAGSRAQEPASCNQQTSTFAENFDTDQYKNVTASSVADWPSGPITLNKLGANFDILQPNGMGAQIYVCDKGDFNGDGKVDLMGLDIGNNHTLRLVLNNYEDADGDGVDDDGNIYFIDPSETYENSLYCGPAAISVADYNNDGLLDFFFMKNLNDEFAYTDFVAVMYINCGTATDPDFMLSTQAPNLNFTAEFRARNIYINWAANHICSVDIDKDGDVDVLVISQDKIFLLRNPGPSNFLKSNFSLAELKYDRKTGYTAGRGGSAIAAGDFNLDGYVDLITGTVNDVDYLAMYLNDKKGNFTRWDVAIPDPECTGTVGLCAQDFNRDGRVDIFGATDRWNAGNEAHMWIYFNRGAATPPATGINFEFRCLNDCLPILPDPHDADFCTAVDYDGDGDQDVVLADANHSGDYYLIKNNVADVFATHGEAVSTNIIGELDPTLFAVTQVQLLNIRQGVLGGSSEGLSVDIFVTSNGTDWEHYLTFEDGAIRDTSNLPVHKFKHFGARLLWKAVLNAATDEMVEFEDASFETPFIEAVEFQYTYVERREYSRTSVTATVTDELNRSIKLIIGASFYFPGWQGQLRAYDLTDMPQVSTSESVLRTVTRSDLTSPTGREIVAENVNIYWDAGRLLAARTAESRDIYTALREEGALQRVDFSQVNTIVLAPVLQDVNNDNVGLINHVRGAGRLWKLGDMNHSNPIVVDPPSGDESRMGAGYAEFKETWKDRPSCLYVGANDGMLHCFDVKTGEERWGFIPFNLLPKLRNMWAVETETGRRYHVHDVYVDGSASVSDAYIDSNGDGIKEWVTILVCGQGPGAGSTLGGGLNYYFAVDITNPESPRPLWEFTNNYMGETWSRPEIGKVMKDGVPVWAAFMGSGYDNDTSREVGNVFYAITLEDGNAFWYFKSNDTDTKTKWPSGANINNAFPGSPSAADINQDGLLDRVYIGDLDGHLWKIDVSVNWVRANSWNAVAFYDDKNYFPIITKPAVWMNSMTGSPLPSVYFGTGGDDAAPDDAAYSFVCLRDTGSAAETEWFIGDPAALGLEGIYQRGHFVPGEKVWADPQVANFMVFFSTLTGNIESVDPCQDIAGEGKLYARFLQAIGGGQAGSTALKSASGAMEYMALEIKARAAVTLGGTETASGVRKKEIYIHEFDSTIQKLEQPTGSTLKIKSWREVYRIIR